MYLDEVSSPEPTDRIANFIVRRTITTNRRKVGIHYSPHLEDTPADLHPYLNLLPTFTYRADHLYPYLDLLHKAHRGPFFLAHRRQTT